MINFYPMNDLEISVSLAKRKEISVLTFLQQLIHSDLALPSATEVKSDGTGFEPILYDRTGIKMVAAFTDKSRIGELIHTAEYCLTMNGLQVLRRIPSGYGLVINPGLKIGLELSPDGIVKIINDLG